MLKSSCFVTMAVMLATALFCAAAHAQNGETKHVVIVLTNHAELGDTGRKTGFYLSEAAHPWHVFTEAGYDVTFVSPWGGEAPIDPKSLDRSDPINAAFLDEVADGDHVDTKVSIEIEPAETDAIFFAGGHGTMWDFPDCPVLKPATAAIYENGGVVAAVCHGPVALVNVQLDDGSYLVAGKRVAAFTNAEERAVELTETMPFLLQTKLEERGAEVVTAANFEKNVVVDGRLVTGQNPASATGAAEAVVGLLDGSE